MDLSWLRYELRRVGPTALAMPLAIVAGFTGVALLMRLGGVAPERAARAVVAGLELGVSLAAGLAAATLVSGDPALELQLALATPYRTTFARRLALMLGWSGVVAVAAMLGLRLLGYRPVPQSLLSGQLTWLAPLLWFAGAGAALTLALRSRAAGSALLAGIWLGENLLAGLFASRVWLRPVFLFAATRAPDASFWLANRLELTVTGLALLGVALLLLARKPELLLGGEA